jgi:DNA polymerase elongation subunit (family B)
MTTWPRTIDVVYTTETDGYRQKTPVVHYFGRDTDWNRHHIEIDTYRPYFLVRTNEWATVGSELDSDDRVMSVETTDMRGRTERAIDGETLLRVVCRHPSDVRDLRELVDDPFEADVQFPTRFLIDIADTQWIAVDDQVLHTEDPIGTEDIHLPDYENDVSETPESVPPLRHCLYDIEVRQGGDGPPVVSEEGTERADNPITAITAYDSYTMEYESWILTHSEWVRDDVESVREYEQSSGLPLTVNCYENPHDVVGQFCEWVIDRDFDSLVAWSGQSFDHPYLVNYGLSNGVGAIKDLSPTGDTYPMSGDGSFINSQLKGRLLLDLMELYQKTRVHKLDSYRLTDVAKEEGTTTQKLDIGDVIDVPDDAVEIDYAWQEHPAVFTEYSLKDVQACVEINNQTQKNVTII